MKFNRSWRKITIESYSVAKNAWGEDQRTWSTYLTAAAEVQQGGGKEGTEQMRETAVQRKVFVIRYYAGVTEEMRINYDSRYFDILHIQEMGDREALKITAEARQ